MNDRRAWRAGAGIHVSPAGPRWAVVTAVVDDVDLHVSTEALLWQGQELPNEGVQRTGLGPAPEPRDIGRTA